MRKIVCTASMIAVLVLSLNSCKFQNKAENQENQDNAAIAIDAAHNSKNSVDWVGVYTGKIPCADCPGINVEITLNADETYQLSYQYIDRDQKPVVISGKFTWDNDGGMIQLDNKDFSPYYKVGENRLFQMDMEGKPVVGDLAKMYELVKEIK